MLLVIWSLTSPFRKLVISIFLSSGIFVISASIIRTSITLTGKPSSFLVNSWGVRETFVGIVTVNLAIFAPILRRAFWTHGSYQSAIRHTSSGAAWDTLQYNRPEQGMRESRTEDGFIPPADILWPSNQSCGHEKETGHMNKGAKMQKVASTWCTATKACARSKNIPFGTLSTTLGLRVARKRRDCPWAVENESSGAVEISWSLATH